MFINYFLKSSLQNSSSTDGNYFEQKPKSFGFVWLVLMLVFSVTGMQAQTTIINPATDGGFNLGSTFAANGWTVANEGTGAVKWAVGSAVSDTSPGTTQTASTMPITSYSVTLSALNQNIVIGQSVSGTNIQPNTYVSNISGTTLTLTLPTTNAVAASNVLLTFGALSSNISGNSAYLSLDNGATHATNVSGIRTIYFYKDVAIPAGHTNIALSFDWKSAANTWQVFAAPTSVTPVGSNVQTSFPATIPGATPIIYSNTNTTTQSAFGFIPASFAGTTVRLIFMWSNGNGGGTNPPLAVDNISLVSRVGGQSLTSVSSGLFTSPSTWDLGYVPSPSDDLVISAGHTIDINEKNTLGARDLAIAGAGAVVQFGFFSDQFTVSNDLFISGSGARFNVYQPTNIVAPAGTGKLLKVGHDISFTNGGRLDISFGSSSAGVGELNLNGTSLQTISTDAGSFLGGITKLNTTGNTFGIINQLTVTNTSTATPNIDWQINNARIRSKLTLTSGRVALGSNKIILGNYGALSTNVVCSLGTGFIGGIVSRWYTTSANPSSGTIDAGLDYNNANVLFPIINANGQNRWASILTPASGTVAGELAITYTDASTMSAVSIADGITIGTRYDGNWAISTPDSRVDTAASTAAAFTYTNAGTAFALGFYATGAFATNDGSTRILYGAAAAGGTHINGTTAPFAARSGLTLANLTSGPMYVGGATTSVQGGATKTSTGSGDWNTAGTWTPSGVPACGDIVTIASGHTVTVNATASAAGVTINTGGTLVNAGGTLTVGCTNNNAIFTNFGTSTVSGGTLRVNGGVYHRAGSTFNHTSGDVTIDSNNAGNASTSVGQGGSSLKLDTSNLNLTGGTITIVDPLVNNVIATSATSVTNFTMSTIANTFAKPLAADAPSGSTVISISNFNRANTFSVGQEVSGTGIAPGTTITALNVPQTSVAPIGMTLSQPTTALILTGATVNFAAMNNNSSVICFPTSTANWSNIAVGQIVTGNGIPAGTTVTGFGSGFADSAYAVFLSNAVTGLATSPIVAAETITFSGASPSCSTIILPAANPSISVGQAVSGTGIAPGTTVSAITTVGTQVRLDLSLPCTGAMVAPVALNFYAGNLNSYAVAYNALTNYSAGLNHTLQIGDGVSSDKAAVTTNGFLCNFIQGGGMLSLGNLTINNALEGADRFFNVTNVLSVQNALNITSGSVFKKTNSTGGMFFGGNITNNGSLFMAANTLTSFANAISGATTLPQTISGSGNFYNNLTTATSTASFAGLTVNNTSTGGVTISFLNFRVANALTMSAGIIHTSATYPLYHGAADLTGNPSIGFSSAFSDTCFIDGPYSRSIPTNSTSNTLQQFPVGKTSYTPIWVGVTGGATLVAEAYTSNGGTTSANASNLSATNWRVAKDGALGAMSDYKVQLGHPSTGANNIIVQSPTVNGTYDNTFGNTVVYTAGTPNTIAAPTVISGAGYTSSYFAYATTPNCTTFNPGNTIADLSSTTNIVIQNSSSTGIVNGSANVTLQATASPLIVAGLIVSGNGIQPGTTVVSVSGTALVLSLPATASSASQTTLTFSTTQNPSTLCGSQLVNLSLQNSTTASGISYQWQSSTDGITYNNISGATGTTYVGSPSQNTYYRCNATCAFGPSTIASTPVQVTFSTAMGTTTPGTTCTASTPVSLEATAASGVITWYNSATGGLPLATGGTYSPSPATTTTYYVATESTSTYTVGKSLTGTATSTANFTGVVFNTSKNIILNSVKVYPRQTAGALDAGAPMTIKLFKDGVQVAGADPVVFTPVTNTGAISSSFVNTVNLNYNIPAGNGYTLLVTSGLSATNMLARIAPGTATLPVGAGSVTIALGASNFDTTTNGENNNFFDLNVTEICASPRVAVEATVGCTKNLKLFIEGYYIGGGAMAPVKANQGVGTSTTDVDDVTVELRDATTYALVATTSAVLKTDGSVAAKLVAPAGNYFIAVKHRNAIQTWSSAAEAFGTSTATYDFSTAANKAYGDNMKNLGSGVFGFYSGDINQDNSIDIADFPALFSDNDNFVFGYYNTDLNGDGSVDIADFPVIFLNTDNFIYSINPTN